MCISKPHMMTTHMSTPGSNALSVSIRFPDLTAGYPPTQLLEPTHCPRTGRDSPAIHLDEASLHASLVLKAPAGPVLTSLASGPRHVTAHRICAASRRVRSPALPVEEKHRESPPERQSQPHGVRAHGALPEAGNRCGAGTRWIADHSTADRRSSNLACTNEATPRGESPDGTTPRIPTATRPRHPRVPTATRPRQLIHRITVDGMCCEEGSLMKSEWGTRGALVHLHPSRPDDSPPSVVRRHPKPGNTDKHIATNMFPHILSSVCT